MRGSKAPACPLEIRVRRTLSADGKTSTYSTVYCPRQRRSVRANECLDCKEYLGLSFDREEQSDQLLCRESHTPTPRQRLRELVSQGPQKALWKRFRGRADRTPVSTVMSLNVYCVREDVSAGSLARVLLESGFGGAPVVDGEGKAIGVVSKTDLVRHDCGRQANNGNGVQPKSGAQKTVGEIMTPVSFTLNEGASVSQAAALMAFEGIHRVPVVDDLGKVIGLLSSLDILHWLAGETGHVVPAPRSWRSRR